MALRIDSSGYFLDQHGLRFDDPVLQRNHDKWKAVIQQDWNRNHPGTAIPADQTIMAVEPGDFQWSIAQGVGADPARTAYSMNAQFVNPDLIYPDNIVFVAQTKIYATTGGSNGRPLKDDSGIFADQTDVHAGAAISAANPGKAAAAWASVKADVDRYMSSIPRDRQWGDAVQNLIFGHPWGTDRAGRQLVMQSFLEHLDLSDRAAGVEWLNKIASGLPDGPNKVATLEDIKAADSKVPGGLA